MNSRIPTASLVMARIPAEGANIGELIEFADTFDGIRYAGSIRQCAEIASKRTYRSIDDIRAALFFEARQCQHHGEAPDNEALRHLRSLVAMIRHRIQIIDTASPAWLADAIRLLPPDEAVPSGTQGYNQYRTQKDHWLGWLDPSAGTGSYRRRTGEDAPARLVYNRIGEPKMLLWLAEAAGVAAELIAEARSAADKHDRLSSKCGAVRKVVPWRVVADALLKEGTRG